MVDLDVVVHDVTDHGAFWVKCLDEGVVGMGNGSGEGSVPVSEEIPSVGDTGNECVDSIPDVVLDYGKEVNEGEGKHDWVVGTEETERWGRCLCTVGILLDVRV